MGSNSSTAHAPYEVTPTLAAETTSAPTPPAGSAVPPETESAVGWASAVTSPNWDPDGPFGTSTEPVDPLHRYAQLVEAVQAAQLTLEEAAQGGAEVAELRQQLDAAVQQYLSGLSADELQQIAAAHGFSHPSLVSKEALEQWLNPSADTGSKAMIAAKADERYAQLCAGETYKGMTLADVQVAEKALPAPTWTATYDQVQQAHQTVSSLAAEYTAHLGSGKATGTLLGSLIEAENRLTTASCPGHEEELAGLRYDAHLTVNEAVAGGEVPDLTELTHTAWESGKLTYDEAHYLSPLQTVAALRDSTGPSEHAALAALAAERGAEFTALTDAATDIGAYKAGSDAPLVLPMLTDEPHAFDHLAYFTKIAGTYGSAQAAVHTWADGVPALADHPALAGAATPADLTDGFKAWAKQQKLADLRQAAYTMGLDDTKAASRAQVQDWIAAHWDPAFNASIIQTAISSKAAASHKTAKASSHAAETPSQTVPGKATAGKATPEAGKPQSGFGAKHQRMLQALQQAKATAADLPKWIDDKTVQSWDFGSGELAQLGGMHSKSLHTGPDGGKWMFKPDHQADGARAHAEAAAAQIFHAAGIPCAPVYTAKVDGASGSVQPLIKGATQLSAQPSSWTQADVDAMVRLHVAAWAVGDHDAKADNILRTPSGGLVGIDQGQSFKFYGQDKLDIDYHPNATYGAPKPVFHQAYEAHLKGALSKGVKVNPLAAHPVIKAIEAIPDTQWRALLHATAHEGAKSGKVYWHNTMRSRAAKKHGVPEHKVAASQIAEAFLDYACQRKNSLREEFTAFFTKLKLPGASALKHGT